MNDSVKLKVVPSGSIPEVVATSDQDVHVFVDENDGGGVSPHGAVDSIAEFIEPIQSHETAVKKDVSVVDPSGLPVGQYLAAARVTLGMTVEQIADQLKLSPRQIDAIETENYAALPDSATVRGFMRSYAKLLKLDPNEIMRKLQGEIVKLPTQEVSRPVLDAPYSEGSMPWLGGARNHTQLLAGSLLVVVLLVVVLFLYRQDVTHVMQSIWPHSTATPVGASAESISSVPVVQSPHAVVDAPLPASAVAATPAPESPPASGSISEAVVAPMINAPVAPAPTPVSAAVVDVPVVANTASPTVAGDGVATANALIFTFNQDSWLQIKRPDGRIVFARLVKAGGKEAINVDGPMSVVVGNAHGVEASLRGQALPLKVAPGGNVSYINVN